MLELFLVRHAQAQRKLPNPSLTQNGQQQAAQLAAWLRTQPPFDALYSSDLFRAQETALVLEHSLGIPTVFEARLREFRGWSAEGFPMDLGSLADNHTPERESWEFFCQRVEGALSVAAARHPNGRVVWVTHGGVLGVLVARAFRWRASPGFITPVHHTGCSCFRYDAAGNVLQQVFHNSLCHLSREMVTA